MAFVQSSLDSPLSALAPAANTATPVEAPETEERPEPEPAQDDGFYGRGETPVKDFLVSQIDDVNLARNYAPDVLGKLGMQVVFDFNIDENSRSDWKEKAEKALKFATQESEVKQYPWPGSANIIFPLITTAALQFNAVTYPAIIRNRNVVKGVVWGSDKGTPATDTGKPGGKPKMHPDNTPVWLSAPGEKRQRADRIGEHMSWQLLEEMPEWEAQTDQLLFQIPIIGGACRKTYRDPIEGRNRSLLVSLKNLVWNYHAPSFEAAPRHTEILTIYPHEIETNERSEIFLPMIYGPGGSDETNPEQAQAGDESAPQIFLEQHCRYDLDEDGYPEPYIVTVHKRSAKVLRIVARYDEDGIKTGKGLDVDEEDDEGEDGEKDHTEEDEVLRVEPVEHYTLIPFLPNPDGGSYPVGFGHLLRPLNEAINTSLNMMVDAGHLQNAGGGFVSDQLSIHSGPVNFQVGKYVRVGSKGQAIRDAVYPIPFPGPSNVLFQLLGLLITSGKEAASIQAVVGDAAMVNTAPTTMLALIEQGMKVYTAIHKRVYRALKSEFAKLYRLNRIYLTEPQQYRIGDEFREITAEDYQKGGGVEPIADPSMITDMQKLGRAQILLMLKDDPLLNKKEIYTRLFDAANIDRLDELFVPPQPPNPMLIQLALAEKQAELGRMRAQEQQYQTQALLNMALARAKASGPEVEWIEKQLDLLRLHIEATNTMVRAADVEARSHGHVSTQEATNAARANLTAGPSPQPPAPVARNPLAGNAGPGLSAVAPQPDNGGIPPVPPGLGGNLPPGGSGPIGGGIPPATGWGDSGAHIGAEGVAHAKAW